MVQRNQALEHLKKDLQFTEEDNEKLKTFVMQVAGKPETQLKQESKSKVKKFYLKDIQEMLKKEKSVTEARIQLKSRGWKENIYLPVSWLTKMLKQKKMINVLSPDGKLFNSYKSLIAHLRDNPEYQEDDIRRLVRFPDGKVHQKIETLVNTVLPASTGPAEKTRKSRKYTLKHYVAAIKSKTDPGELASIRQHLLETGWKEDSSLVPR